MASDFSAIADAVVLMAGSGSRLRAGGHEIPKPLVPLLGRPLVSYLFETLRRVGVERVHAVVGAHREELLANLDAIVPPELEVNVIENREWRKQNGISLLQAEPHLHRPFLLTMADHLFEGAVFEALISQTEDAALSLAIDRKIKSIFDLDDAMKVQTRAGRVTAIGKNLAKFDAIDTGAFLCRPEIFRALHAAKENGDCSLADGVRVLALEGKVNAVEIGAAWWQDVDTPEMLREAERALRRIRPAVPSREPVRN